MNKVFQSLTEQMRITEHDIERRKVFMSFGKNDVTLLKEARVWMEPLVMDIVRQFYILQTAIPEISLIIGDRETLNNLHKGMQRYIRQIFQGQYDLDYVETRLRIGKVHHRIGVSPKLYLSGINQLQLLLEDVIDDHGEKNNVTTKDLKQAVRKLLYFDNQFVFDTYISSLQLEVESANVQLEEYASRLEDQVAERTRELTELSLKDPLTNLYNQRAFYEQLEKGCAQVERVNGHYSLLYIDVNKFKTINDTKGHKVGDEILMAVAEAISSTVRMQETASRYGGDEFCILLPNTKAENLIYYCERLFGAFDKIKPLDVTLSVGGAEMSPAAGYNIDDLIIRADKQMYLAKQEAHATGKNQLRVEVKTVEKA
ncbi:GGDEF domain-containing protein [Vibrio sp. CK2-1]|uniref:GGDEF domain-containing protein n=1 Tax=Vibrio sp. CK2-1 TaxID=2912249 RepID=UPI001F3B576F|nr:GGDEF domain-containing protein [Vibrio sp. CK2-1]MCF7354781.1 GGDEF domain-containing protein [Vibrio sp. CK2-1]